MRFVLIAMVIALAGLAAAGDAPPRPTVEPHLPGGVVEVHGAFGGQPFWARLLPPDKQFGGHRVLQLVYQPPPPESIAGAHLSDCPFVLLDEQARVVAWNGRETLSQALPAAPSGYRVTRELSEGQGDEAKTASDDRAIPGERAWDLSLAPLLLALAWHPDKSGAAAVVDLFGPRSAERMTASWNGEKADIAGAACTVAAGADGHAQTIADAAGKPLLQIAAWTTGAKP